MTNSFAPKKRGRPTLAMVEARRLAEEAKANAPKKSNEEILSDLVEGFDELSQMTAEVARGNARSLIVTGRPGIGKTYNIDNTLEAMKHRFVSVSGGISAPELYKLAYKHKHKGEVIVIDDCDNVFRDEDSLNILKALTDTTRNRVVSWRKDSKTLTDDGIEKFFTFNGGIIFSSNLDFQSFVDEGKNKYAYHMAALISRSYYLDLHLHDLNSLSLWISHVALKGRMFEKEGVSLDVGVEILDFLHENKDSLREYSLRTVRHVCNLSKMSGNWRKRSLRYLCR